MGKVFDSVCEWRGTEGAIWVKEGPGEWVETPGIVAPAVGRTTGVRVPPPDKITINAGIEESLPPSWKGLQQDLKTRQTSHIHSAREDQHFRAQ